MKKIFMKILNFYLNTRKINKKTILIIETSFPSGSNTEKVYQKLNEKYEVDVISNTELVVIEKTIQGYLNYLKTMNKVAKYNYLVCSHGYYKKNDKQILIDLWHGIPIKSMMYMESDNSIYKKEGYNADYLITSSKIESALMAACTHITNDRHRILGSPRNDYLFDEKVNLKEFDFIKKYQDVILYVPTYRQGYMSREEGRPSDKLFHFEEFDKKTFINYLKANNILLIIKYHPFEENKNKKNSLDENIYYLNNQILIDNNMDLYELLPYTDLLITDYSSIYFDYLLLDKPVVFTPVDLTEYSEDRGLLLEPYELWTPGPKSVTQESLQEEILNSLHVKNYYSDERKKLRTIFHKYQDGKSTERVITLIEEIVGK